MPARLPTDSVTADEVNSTYNEYFVTEAEARLGWALYQMATRGIDRYMDRPIRPMPGDRPQRKATTRSGDIFARVKEEVAVEELARKFTTLRTAGQGKLHGRCPIHDEKTPSFFVYIDSRSWRCYGACATGGDVISLGQALIDLRKL